MLYMLAMLPLGILYFTVFVTLMTTAVACIGAPFLFGFGAFDNWIYNNWDVSSMMYAWQYPLCLVFGIVLLFATLHLARGLGKVHGIFAKHMLVKNAQYA